MRLRRKLADWLRSAYLRIGIHTAPPGTLFYFVHTRIRALAHRRALRYVSGDVFARGRFGGTTYYDIARVCSVRRVDGLALIFFIGLGDYLLATPFIEALRLAHPGLLIYAFASTSTNLVSSGLVAPMLRANRHIDAVFTYRGRPSTHWLDYDFRDCLKDVPRNFIILPVIYSIDPAALHRVTSLLEAFNLPVRLPILPPILETSELSPSGAQILAEITGCMSPNASPAIVCCHFGTRSSKYLYPHRNELVRSLVRSGYIVVALTEVDVADPNVVPVDIGQVTMLDTIEILRSLKADGHDLYIVSVNSVMWPVSSGLDITNLGLHIYMDSSIHQYIYPNIYIVTQHIYTTVSPSRVFLAPPGRYEQQETELGVFTDYDADFVIDCFEQLRAIATAPKAP